MADGMQNYNLPNPQVLANFTAPTGVSEAPAPLRGVSLPPPVNFMPQPAAQGPVQESQPAPNLEAPPTFPMVLAATERRLGTQLTPEQFDQLYESWKTRVAAPALQLAAKGKKAIFDTEMASVDSQAQQLRASRYKGTEEEKTKSNALGDFIGATLASTVSSTGRNLLAQPIMAAAALASGFGTTHNALSDALFKYGIDPNTVASGKTDQQAGQDFAKLIMGHNYDNPQFASLRQKLEAQGAANNPKATGLGGVENQLDTYAQGKSGAGAAVGDVLGMLAAFAATRKFGGAPTAVEKLPADASKLARTINRIRNAGMGGVPKEAGKLLRKVYGVRTEAPSAALLGTGFANQSARQNTEQGQQLSSIFKQYGVDVPIDVLGNLLPVSAAGNALKRAVTGAVIGEGQAAARGIADATVNPENPAFDPASLVGKEGGTQAALGAALALLFGQRGGNALKKAPEATPRPAPAPEAPTPAATPAADAAPASAPIDLYSTSVNNAPEAGIEQPAFIKGQAAALKKANDAYGAFKSSLTKTPEGVVNDAIQLSQRFTGKAQWAKLSAEQRHQTIETMAAFLGKKTKVDAESIAARLQTLANPAEAAPTPAQPTVTEIPLPADITGSQVAGTTPQETTAPVAPTVKAAPTQTAVRPEINELWQSLTDPAKANPVQLNNPLIARLDAAIKAGKITSPEHLQTLLDEATAKAAAKPKAAPKPEVAETPKPEAPKNTLKAKPKAEPKPETEAQYNKRYFSALINREKAPSSPEETALRNAPAFNSAAEAMRAGKITSAEDVGRFLKGQKGTDTVGDALAGHENKLVGAVLSSRSTKSELVQARRAVRENVVDPLLKLGEDKATINKMTVAQATAHLQKLANTFSGSETALPKSKALKAAKSKTEIEPVEKPADEPVTPKPKKGLAKKTAPKKEAGKTKAPKSEAPASETGAATPLEGLLTERLGSKLPPHDIDALHDAITEAQMGDKGPLGDLVGAWQGTGDLTRAEGSWLRDLGKREPLHDLHENNASGESSASLEAQRRIKDERAAGQTRAIIRRDGSVEPLVGVDAVDTHARAGEVVAQRAVGRDKWTILSHGDDLTTETARGKLNRAEAELNNTHENAGRDTGDEVKIGEHTLHLSDLEALDRGDTTPVGESKSAPIQTTRRINKIIDNIREGSDVIETGRDLQRLSDELAAKRMEARMKAAMRGRRRGVEWVRAKLQRLIADSAPESKHTETAKFALWLLDKAPHLADDLAISIRDLGSSAGRFIPLSRLVAIDSTKTNPGTAVHEILHSAEQLMPKELQNKIRGEYIGRIQNKIKQAKKANNKWAQVYLEHAVRSFVRPSAYSRSIMKDILRKHSDEVPASEYYKYFDASEYFAVEGTSILSRKHAADSWIGHLKNWMAEYWQHAKALLGLDSNSEVYKALKQVMDTAGERPAKKSKMLNESKETVHDISEEQQGENPSNEGLGYEPAPEADTDPTLEKEAPKKATKVNLSEVNNSQRFIENYMGADYGLEKHMQAFRRAGLKATEANDVETAAYEKNGISSRYNKTDRFDALDPAVNWMYANVVKFADDMPDFLHKLNKFFGNTNWLERGYTSWYDESPLDIDGALDRAEIKDKLANRDITGAEARKQIIAIAKKHAQFTPEEWMRHEQMPLDTINAELAKLSAESGMDQSSMKALNDLVELARNRTRERLIEAGRFSEDDPYRDYYGWKWYVPLKGSAYNGRDDGNFDLVPTRNIGLRILNAQIKTMEGRKGFAEQPFVRMFVDMARAGSDAASSKVRKAAYHNQVDTLEKFNEELDAAHGDAAKNAVRKKYEGLIGEIHTFEGSPKEGYTNTQTGAKVDRLKAPMNGVIVNDGDTHYVLTFPKNSQLRRGLALMDAVEQPSDNLFAKSVAKTTNVLARLYTTVDPGWQTFKGFVRDLTYIPATVGAKMYDNPIAAVGLWANYAGNVIKAYKAAPTFWAHVSGDVGALRRMAAENPEGWAGLVDRYEAAGGSNDFTKGFDIPGMEKIMQARLKDIGNNIKDVGDIPGGIWDATKWGGNKVLEYTGNYANFLEAIGRVAMFKTLSDMGHTDKAAALEVRKALDYSKSGIKGRRINSWLAFFRVGMTGADAMRRAFTKPTGGFDYVKAAKWQSFMAALGYIGVLGMNAVIGKDDDGVDKLAKVEPGLLTQKLIFPLPNGKLAGMDLGLGLPQVMLAPGILAAAASLGHIKWDKASKVYLDTLARNGPITPAGIKSDTIGGLLTSYILGFTPTIARPLVDIDRNVNVFDAPIHRDQDNNKYASDSGRPNTPQEFKEMATWLRESTDGVLDYYPEDIRYLIQSYGGQLGTGLVRATTSNPDVNAGGSPTPSRMVSRVIVDTSHYMQNELYDTLDKLQDSRRRYNSIVARAKDDGASSAQAKAQADQILSRDTKFKKELQAYKALDSARRDYAKKITELRNNKLLSDTRKKLLRKRLDTQLREAIEKAQEATAE